MPEKFFPHPRLWLFAIAGSGALSLAYELIWTRFLALSLGSEYLALWIGLSGYFIGLGIGSFLVHRYASSIQNIGKWLAASELLAALYAILIAPLCLPQLGHIAPQTWMISDLNHDPIALSGILLIASVALLPACMCIGAILPLTVRYCLRFADRPSTASVYATHTLGAVFGTLVAIHFVLPNFGLLGGSWVFAGFGCIIACLFLVVSHTATDQPTLRRNRPHRETQTPWNHANDPDQLLLEEPWLIEITIGLTGILGLGIEVLATIILSQYLQGTIYAFAHILAVYLASMAFGAWLYTKIPTSLIRCRPAGFALMLLIASALVCSATAITLRQSGESFSWLAGNSASFSQYSFAEIMTAVSIFACPMTLAGMLYAHWLSLLENRGIGLAQAWSSFACALSPLILAFFMIPYLGFSDSWFALAWGYGLVAGTFAWFRRFSKRWQLAWIFGVLVSSWLARGPIVKTTLPPQWELITSEHSVYGVVTVSRWKPNKKPNLGESSDRNPSPKKLKQSLHRLQVGQHFRMGGAMSIGERRMGHLPFLLLPTPKHMLFVGVGTGATAGAALHYPITRLDAIELVPQIIALLDHFSDVNSNLAHDPRVNLHPSDIRRWLSHQSKHWDLAVADLFHPNRDFAGNLYTVEYFQNIRDHLHTDGHFVQWLPLYQFDEADLQSVVASFLKVFPNTHSWLGLYNARTPVLGLISKVRDTPFRIDISNIQERLQDPIYQALALTDIQDILAGYMHDSHQLEEFSANAELNRDLHPRLIFATPRARINRYTGSKRLAELLRYRIPFSPDFQIEGIGDPQQLRDQIAEYAAALDLYLQAEIELIAIDQLDNPGNWPHSKLDLYLRAFERQPHFLPTRFRLMLAVQARPKDASMILARMRKRIPHDPRLKSIHQ